VKAVRDQLTSAERATLEGASVARRALPGISSLRRAWRWLVGFETQPAPVSVGRAGRWALVAVAVAALAYTVVFTLYTVGLQETFRTHAEDLGIMDQVLWNTAHGLFMRQTICNPITDTNCLGGITRFSIHFEPILIPLALIYRMLPDVRVLLFLQSAGVASGAFPAYLLGARRLRHISWGLLFAAVYLLYPPLIAAVIDDFHPETMAAGLLMWALYFLFTRRYCALVVSCAVLVLCKETLALDVLMIGLFVAVIQRRPRLGWSLAALGAGTLLLALGLAHLFSPVGYSPVDSRFAGFLHNPLGTLKVVLTDSARYSYLVKVLAPVGFLPLLSPWTALLAAPALAINLASNDPHMYSGIYQYNTDIGPIFVAASIDALVWVLPALSRAMTLLRGALNRQRMPRVISHVLLPRVVIVVAVLLALFLGGRGPAVRAYHDLTLRGVWPAVTTHDLLGDQILRLIPPNASVSAQSTLAAHLSQRARIHQFPSGAYTDQYVALDVTASDYYPYTSPQGYVAAIRALLTTCQVSVLAADDGYLLLRRISTVPQAGVCPIVLPSAFYTFAYTAPPSGATAVSAVFSGVLALTAYKVDPPQVYADEPELTLTTCWRTLAPVTTPLTVVMTLAPPHGSRIVLDDSLTQEWLPPQRWIPGQSVCLQTWPIYLQPSQRGALVFGAEVRVGNPASLPPASAVVPVTSLANADSPTLPRVAPDGMRALLTVVPFS
jgi:uncharacterized membrane protein